MEPKPIRELQSEVVDQIAAGEVVERPAHLVKELIENSLDAGATTIEVEFDHGGRDVRVTDNGVGIRPNDLRLAVHRHATSKIESAGDLWLLRSYGFRGEALASIGAVSRLELVSRPKAEALAHRIRVEFGAVAESEPGAGNLGTTIGIRDLFENVPARLKFMKSEAAEGAQVRAVVRAAAMARPDVGFRLKSKGKVEFTYREGETFLQRVQTILGVSMHQGNGEFEGLKTEFAFSGPQDVLGNSKGLWFFVQDRWVQDRSLAAAVLDAYRGLLMHGEFPYVAMRVTAPDGEVDVNIHPTKSAVKFQNPSRAFRAVSRTLRAAIESAPWLGAETRGSARANLAVPGGGLAAPRSASGTETVFRIEDFTRPYQAAQSEPVVSASDVAAETTDSMSMVREFRFESRELDQIQLKQKPIALNSNPAAAEPARHASTKPWSRLEVLGQAHLTYVLCQDHDRLVLIDQHAAHERVAYERLMRAWRAKTRDQSVESQSLLLPILVELEPEHAEALAEHEADLQKIGLSFERMGPRTVGITSLPVFLKESTVAAALKELAIASLERGGSEVFEQRIGDVFARLACHSVVRAGQALSREQMVSLLEQMDEFPLSSFCPHGRPVSVEYPFSQLEKDFGRTV